MSESVDYDAPCDHCQRATGDHTIREMGDCLNGLGLNHNEPFEEVAAGGMTLPFDQLVGDVQVKSLAAPTPLGVFPVLMFTFKGPGPIGGSHIRPPVALLLDPEHMRAFAKLVHDATEAAIRKVGLVG